MDETIPPNARELPSLAVRDELYEQYGRIGAAIASPVRLLLLSILSHGPRSVEELTRASGQQTANVSAHLKTLRLARLVRNERDGKYVIYSLSTPAAHRLVSSIRELAEETLPEVRELTARYYDASDGSVATIDVERLREDAEQGRVVLIDLREPSEYAAGRIPAARSIPFEELDEHLDELRAVEVPVYVYCRGKYCVRASLGTAKLRAAGIPARRLPYSIHAWTSRGESLEVDAS